MTDTDLIEKKLAFIETCVRELRAVACDFGRGTLIPCPSDMAAGRPAFR